jgi:hypothetical protein
MTAQRTIKVPRAPIEFPSLPPITNPIGQRPMPMARGHQRVRRTSLRMTTATPIARIPRIVTIRRVAAQAGSKGWSCWRTRCNVAASTVHTSYPSRSVLSRRDLRRISWQCRGNPMLPRSRPPTRPSSNSVQPCGKENGRGGARGSARQLKWIRGRRSVFILPPRVMHASAWGAASARHAGSARRSEVRARSPAVAG